MRSLNLQDSSSERLSNVSRALLAALLSTLFIVFPNADIGPANATSPDPALITFNNGTCDLATAGYSGAGSPADPYLIPDADSLWEVADCSITGSAPAHFHLTSNIDVTAAAYASTRSPIGGQEPATVYSFRGVLDGQGHSITGVRVVSLEKGVGLFRKLQDATISHLNLSGYFQTLTFPCGKDFEPDCGTSYPPAGALAAHSSGTSYLTSVSVSATVIGTRRVGGLIGLAGNLQLEGVRMEGRVEGVKRTQTFHAFVRSTLDADYVGGFFGYVGSYATIRASANHADVVGMDYVGGLIGETDRLASIKSSHNIGQISGDAYVAGLVGYSANASIQSSQNAGQVLGKDFAGGLVGLVESGLEVADSSNSGTVSGTLDFIGGLIGVGGGGKTEIIRSFNSGEVSGPQRVGGLMGQSRDEILIESSGNTGIISGSNDVGGLVGLVTITNTQLQGQPRPVDELIFVERSFNSGSISGANRVGGLFGDLHYRAYVINGNFNAGNVSGSGESIGGLAGRALRDSFFLSAYNSAAISGATAVGGVVGSSGGSVFFRGYNAGVVSGVSNFDGLVGSTSGSVSSNNVFSAVDSSHVATTPRIDMKRSSTFPSFSFEDTWGFGSCVDNGGYPMLRTFAELDSYSSIGCTTIGVPSNVAGSPVNIDFNNAVCDLTTAGYAGSGSAADPYLIPDADSLWEVTDCSITQSAPVHFRLTNNIAVTEALTAPTSSPIGFSTSALVYSFSGVLDGANHVVSNIFMSTSTFGVGLFGYLHFSTISNLVISGSLETTAPTNFQASHSAGALAIRTDGSLHLYSISNQATVTGDENVGGLVGYSDGLFNIISSKNSANITGSSDQVGGLVGYSQGDVDFLDSSNFGEVSGAVNVGGLIGNVADSNITSSRNTGTISATAGNNAGGLVGIGMEVNLSSSSNEGAVSGTNEVGGLVGSAHDSSIVSSRNTGAISGGENVGGLIGYVLDFASISSSSNSGTVSGTAENTGGVVGYVDKDITISGSMNEGTVSGSADVGGFIGEVSGNVLISSSRNIGGVTSPGRDVGGLVGMAGGEASLLDAHNEGDIQGYDDVGGLIGDLSSTASITSSHNTGNITGTRNEVGGLIGYAGGNTTLADSSNQGDVRGLNQIGGLVGYVHKDSSVESSSNTGQVSGSNRVGGLVGQVFGNTAVNSSSNTGKISGAADFVGGLVGSVAAATITTSYNTGSVLGSDQVGGLVGYASDSASIETSYNTGPVSGSGYVGGLAGSVNANANITSSYNAGAVSGSSAVGGLLGGASFANITSSYNANAVSGDAFVGGMAGYVGGIANIDFSSNNSTVSGITYVGGLVGYVWNSASIDSSSNTGAISGSESVGGLVGHVAFLDATINFSRNSGEIFGPTQSGGLVGYVNNNASANFSYNDGTVSGTNFVGGLVGRVGASANIDSVYNTGDISGSTNIAGLLGHVNSNAIIDTSYNTGAVTGNSHFDALAGKVSGTVTTTSVYSSVTSRYVSTTPVQDMRDADTFIGFDFESDWGFGTITENQGFPMLRSFGELSTYFSGTSTPSSDSSLISLAVSDGSLSPSFGSETTSYTVSVQHSVTSITLTPTMSQNDALMTVNGVAVTSGAASGTIALSVGSNTITIVVTAEDQTTTTYTLTITRQPGTAQTPSFDAPTKTSDGFTVQISNYDDDFTWAASATVGSANIDQSGLVTVTGVGAGASSTITITTTRTDYSTGTASITSQALNAALTPTFGTPTKTSDGFTVNISNYDGSFSWNLSASNGSASVDSNGLITLTGIAAGASSILTLTTTRDGYANGTASVTGSAIDEALTPTFATPTRTNDGFTVEISNYDGGYGWAASATSGTVSIGSDGVVVLTGLSPSTSSTITITTTRAGYATGTASITSSSLDTALVPTFGAATSTSDGFTAQISNYDGAFSWNLSASNGSASVDSNGLITLTGIAAGASSVVTVTTTRVGFATGTAQTSGSALNAALMPGFAAATRTNDGFTVQLSNYDANFTWTLTVSTGSTSVDSNGLISVTGVGTGLSSTLTIATSRNGHANASTQITSSAIDAALTPAIAAPARTGSGFTALISNYDPNFTWTIAATLGAASIDANGLLTVVGLSPSSSSTVTITTTRTGYASGTASTAGTSLDAALTPSFDVSTRSSDGFVVQLSNYDPNYTWTAIATAGTVSISGSGFVVVAGLSAGAASTITITTTKVEHAQGVATLTQNAIGAATTQTPSTPTPAYLGPVIDSPKSVRAGSRVTFFGSRLDTITAVHVGGIKLVMVSATEKSLVLEVKAPVLAGTHDLVLESSFGTLTFQNGITVLEPETQIVAEATPETEEIQKLTVGSFRGFIAIYTKGHEGQRLSAKVAGKWLVVESLDESFKGNDYSRTVRRTGSGYSIKVHLYIDREFVRVENLTTR